MPLEFPDKNTNNFINGFACLLPMVVKHIERIVCYFKKLHNFE